LVDLGVAHLLLLCSSFTTLVLCLAGTHCFSL
jgi:hypothetical protein